MPNARTAKLYGLLDEIRDQLLKADAEVHRPMRTLTDGLRALKAIVSPEEWRKFLIPAARNHVLHHLVRQCPLTARSVARPRGYPGDAVLLDLIYGHPSASSCIQAATPMGRAIYEFSFAAPASVAVRRRRNLMASYIDDVCMQTSMAEILSIASGHLREAELSNAVQGVVYKRFLATDRDEMCIAEIRRRYSSVLAAQLTVRALIAKKVDVGKFDLIYCAGLYDYLQAATARRLTFSRLRKNTA